MKTLTLEDLMICARTVWMEARGDGPAGEVAVAHVMLNRWLRDDGQWNRDHTLAAACLRWMQFSGWNTGDPNREKGMGLTLDDPTLRDCLSSVLEAVRDREAGQDPTKGAAHYKTPRARPRWAVGHTPCAVIGGHQFFNDVS